MEACVMIPDGWYRLVKWQEDGNPVFPSRETVVEVRSGYIINALTGRRCDVPSLGGGRSLYGPLAGPYDLTGLRKLRRIDLPLRRRFGR